MLSILIPIYNFAVKELIVELSTQATHLKQPFEILCIDDKSDDYFLNINKDIETIKGVVYQRLNKNIGRSKIRNLLAEKAQFNCLLFLDCDVKPYKKDFLKHYLDLSEKHKVIVGGVAYQDFDEQKSKFLRWKYGKLREEKTAQTRQKKPYNSFSASNLLIHKDISHEIRFSESLLQYGHEDTLFGFELSNLAIPILHIDNPIIHLGLDETSTFLHKTELGLNNLIDLKKVLPEVCQKIKICRYYNGLKSSLFLTRPIFKWIKNITHKMLINGNCNLVVFDLYKLSFMLCLKKK